LQPTQDRTEDDRLKQIHLANKEVFGNPSFRTDQVCIVKGLWQ
jgi:hypothetical protein